MIKTKSDKLSEDYKIAGNNFYQKGKFSEALIEYNKAIAFAVSKENLALAYANRSAVFIAMKKYRKCLQNIEWAFEHGYPEDKKGKLLEREEKCRKKIDENFVKEEEELRNFFKLSYPPNPRIPFIVDCVEMKMTKKFGRGIFATRDLKLGDIISIERPVLARIAENTEYTYCCLCMTSKNKNLIPCTKTASLMFCSIECRNEVYEKFKEEDFDCLINVNPDGLYKRLLCIFEGTFGGKENFIKFIKENNLSKWKKTIFDYDLSDPTDPKYAENKLLSILSFFPPLNYKKVKASIKKERSDAIAKVVGDNHFYQDFVEHIAVVWRSCVMFLVATENFPIGTPTYKLCAEGPRAYRFNLFSPLINYSCFPNIQKVLTDAETIYYVTRPIKAGEELLRDVLFLEMFSQDVEERREYYFHRCGFYCMCFYCEKGLKASTLPLGHFSPSLDKFDDYNSITVKQKIAEIKKVFRQIEDYESRSPIGTYESFYQVLINSSLIDGLAYFLEY